MNNPIQAMKERTREKLLSDLSAFCKRAWREIEPRELAMVVASRIDLRIPDARL